MTRAINLDADLNADLYDVDANDAGLATATLVSDLHEDVAGDFSELENWFSDQFETLEKRYASYVTAHSLHSTIKQGR